MKRNRLMLCILMFLGRIALEFISTEGLPPLSTVVEILIEVVIIGLAYTAGYFTGKDN